VICWNGGVFAKTAGLLQRLLPVMMLACAVVMLAQVPAHAACRCVQSDLRTDINRADAVFAGVVVDSSGTSGGSSSAFATYQIEADTLYKGDVRTSTVEVRSQNDDCALGDLKADRRYVFFVTEEGSELRTDRCSGTTASSSGLVSQIEQEVGAGSPLGRSNEPQAPVTVEFTKLSDAEPDSLTRIAAPGAALVLVGLLGLLVVRRVRD
jgi:hypothetical protein